MIEVEYLDGPAFGLMETKKELHSLINIVVPQIEYISASIWDTDYVNKYENKLTTYKWAKYEVVNNGIEKAWYWCGKGIQP